MTIGGWIGFAFFALMILVGGLGIAFIWDNVPAQIVTTLATFLVIVGIFFGFRWYYANTASGQRALVDERSELNNGLDRIVTVYTADGDIIAQYEGQIDIEDNSGGYVVFDFEGKRYMYYNCFVESIADIA